KPALALVRVVAGRVEDGELKCAAAMVAPIPGGENVRDLIHRSRIWTKPAEAAEVGPIYVGPDLLDAWPKAIVAGIEVGCRLITPPERAREDCAGDGAHRT